MEVIKRCFEFVRRVGIKNCLLFVKNRLYPRPIGGFCDIVTCFQNKSGLEIGGPSSIFANHGKFPIYRLAKGMDNVNFSTRTVWTGSIDKTKGFTVAGKRMGNQYIGDAVFLDSFVERNYDFILSCNNIEHIANPLGAIQKWLLRLESNGCLLIVAPRKESNFDHRREVVQFEHLLTDCQQNVSEADLTHLDEILEFHDLTLDPPAGTLTQFKERSLNNFANRCLHHHVFDLSVLKKIFDYFGLEVIQTFQLHSDIVILGRKI